MPRIFCNNYIIYFDPPGGIYFYVHKMKKNTQKLQLKNCPKILIIFFVNVYFSDFSCKKKRNALTANRKVADFETFVILCVRSGRKKVYHQQIKKSKRGRTIQNKLVWPEIAD